jgi:hypothetical protein
MPVETSYLVAQQGGLFAWLYSASKRSTQWKERQADMAQRVQEEREDKLRLAHVLEGNTAAITQLSAIVAELKQVVRNGQRT